MPQPDGDGMGRKCGCRRQPARPSNSSSPGSSKSKFFSNSTSSSHSSSVLSGGCCIFLLDFFPARMLGLLLIVFRHVERFFGALHSILKDLSEQGASRQRPLSFGVIEAGFANACLKSCAPLGIGGKLQASWHLCLSLRSLSGFCGSSFHGSSSLRYYRYRPTSHSVVRPARRTHGAPRAPGSPSVLPVRRVHRTGAVQPACGTLGAALAPGFMRHCFFIQTYHCCLFSQGIRSVLSSNIVRNLGIKAIPYNGIYGQED